MAQSTYTMGDISDRARFVPVELVLRPFYGDCRSVDVNAAGRLPDEWPNARVNRKLRLFARINAEGRRRVFERPTSRYGSHHMIP